MPPFQINPNAFQTSNLEGIFWTPHLICAPDPDPAPHSRGWLALRLLLSHAARAPLRARAPPDGGYIFAFNEGMKWCVRNRPDSFVARYLSW